MKKQVHLFLNTSKINNKIQLIKQLEQEGLMNEAGLLEYDDENEEVVKCINEILNQLSK